MRWEPYAVTGNSTYQKNEGANSGLSDSLLGGGYLRLPMSLTIVVVTLRALFQEREEAGQSRFDWPQKNERQRS